jgi:hypothetical protein
MTNRVKNLEKWTKEISAQVAAWEEANGPFIYAVRPLLRMVLIPLTSCY